MEATPDREGILYGISALRNRESGSIPALMEGARHGTVGKMGFHRLYNNHR